MGSNAKIRQRMNTYGAILLALPLIGLVSVLE